MGLFDIFTGSSAKKYTNQAIGALNQGKTEGLGYLDTGLGNASDYIGQAGNLYEPYAQQGGQANQLYGDSLGLNGTEGNQRAVSAFQTNPGYQFGLDQGIQAIQRNGSALGNLNSGNTDLGLLKYAQGYADQNYNNWQNQLQGLGSQGLQAIGAQGDTLGSLANLYSNTGAQKANIATNTAAGIGNAYTNLGTSLTNASGNIWGALLGTAKAFTTPGK